MSEYVFISYSSQDVDTANLLCTKLEEREVQCWIAPRDVNPGSKYAEEIVRAIQSCKGLVLVYSAHCETSAHVGNEVERAFSYRKPIYPVRIENIQPGAALEYFLGSAQWLDAWEGKIDEYTDILAEVINASDRKSTDFPPTEIRSAPVEHKRENTIRFNLPSRTTSFIGREKEMATVLNLLLDEAVRLVTLSGPGGTGKTRLALEVADSLHAEFPEGIYFVSLAPITDSNLIAPTISKSLGIPENPGVEPLENIAHYLKSKNCLLILDNFEQIVDAAPMVSMLLAACPLLKVLVTSREILHIGGEHDCSVPPMSAPDSIAVNRLFGDEVLQSVSQYDAVRMFIDRAVSIKADFVATNENAPAIAEICHRLDGLPLAIELAVARIRHLPPEAMLKRLEQHLPLLSRGARDLPARQMTLENTIAWSYDLLEDHEQRIFRRLGVFVGGFSLDAAESICAYSDALGRDVDVFEGVSSLVDKSIVREQEINGEPRYFMLETVREFALHRLEECGEVDAIRTIHADYFYDFAGQAEPETYKSNQMYWFRKLQLEIDNMRATLGYLRARHAVRMTDMAVKTFFMWHLGGHHREASEWLRIDPESAHEYPPELFVRARSVESILLSVLGEYQRSESLAVQAGKVATELDDDVCKGIAGFAFGFPIYFRGDFERAAMVWKEASDLLSSQREYWFYVNSLRAAGLAIGQTGDYEESDSYLKRSAEIAHERGDLHTYAYALRNSSITALNRQLYAEAEKMAKESLAISAEHGDRWSMLRAMERVAAACALAEKKNHARAARLLGAVNSVRRDIGAPLAPAEQEMHEEAIQAARESLGEELFRQNWEEGQRMPLEQAVEEALAQ